MTNGNLIESIIAPATAKRVYAVLGIPRNQLNEWRSTDSSFPWSETIGKDGSTQINYCLEACRKKYLSVVSGKEN